MKKNGVAVDLEALDPSLKATADDRVDCPKSALERYAEACRINDLRVASAPRQGEEPSLGTTSSSDLAEAPPPKRACTSSSTSGVVGSCEGTAYHAHPR